jgi:hypothetical protein
MHLDRGRPNRTKNDRALEIPSRVARRILTALSTVMQTRPKFGCGLHHQDHARCLRAAPPGSGAKGHFPSCHSLQNFARTLVKTLARCRWRIPHRRPEHRRHRCSPYRAHFTHGQHGYHHGHHQAEGQGEGVDHSEEGGPKSKSGRHTSSPRGQEKPRRLPPPTSRKSGSASSSCMLGYKPMRP